MDVLEYIAADPAGGAAELEAVVRGLETARAAVVFLRSRSEGGLTSLEEEIAAGLEVREFATAQINLLSSREQETDARTGRHHLDPAFHRTRGEAVLRWTSAHAGLRHLPIGLFADGPAAAAALLGAASAPGRVRGIVCLDGRVDLAEPDLAAIRTDTLLLVAEGSTHLADLNRHAAMQLAAARLELVPHGTHTYDDPRAISRLAWRTVEWFSHVLTRGNEVNE
jgi:putative phosphoribosyl transferase